MTVDLELLEGLLTNKRLQQIIQGIHGPVGCNEISKLQRQNLKQFK